MAQLWVSPEETRVKLPAGAFSCWRALSPPQQAIVPSVLSAQLKSAPPVTWVKAPEGGVSRALLSSPQQVRSPASSSAQLFDEPTERDANEPDGGCTRGNAALLVTTPQQWRSPASATPQLWNSVVDISMAVNATPAGAVLMSRLYCWASPG